MKSANYYCYGYLLISCIVLLIAQFGAGDDAASLPGGTKLIIGVPKKSGFTQFVDVQLNSWNKKQVVQVTGYAIDVFNATIAYLQPLRCNISFEYRAFVNEDGKSAGNYDTLLSQIPEGKYDAVVGDVTIVANRSNYVDFTLPYAESDVKMLVKVRHDPRLNMWIFVRPFSWDLWLSIAIVCILIGGTIRFIERDVKEDSGRENSARSEQLTGVSMLWLPVVQAVFPEREALAKNCSRFVLVMWLILAFVLMQSYTACLSSILTVHQLQPSYPSENDVVRDPKINVGYQCESFIADLLVDDLKFDVSRLKNYSTIEEYKEALDKGSSKGGVDAIFDEVLYIKIFLKEYGPNYAMVGTRHRTGGFGFAFPTGSHLTSYFSKAVLNVSESEEMDSIEQKYFGSSDGELQDQSNSSSDTASPSLTAYSFIGLFMVIGILSLLALLVSESRIWRKPVMLAKTYSQKFLTWSSKKASQSGEGSTTRGNVDEGFTTTANIGSADGADNHPKIPRRSPSCIDIETLPV